MADAPPIRLHHDDALFRAAVAFTAARTGFAARLIEKDYFCTVVLQHLTGVVPGLVFKGGTCLAKVHTGFHRLSEDLDFVLPTESGTHRTSRQRAVAATKRTLTALPTRVADFHEIQSLIGANQSTHYHAVLGYTSRLGGHSEPIAVEISLREPLLAPIVRATANTLLLDPISARAWTPPVTVSCIARQEAMAEKLRAALSRRDPAIRDFFDVDYAVRAKTFDVNEPALLDLVRRKLVVTGHARVDVSPGRLTALRPQVETQLRPVLRDSDFAMFDLDRAFATVAHVAAALG